MWWHVRRDRVFSVQKNCPELWAKDNWQHFKASIKCNWGLILYKVMCKIPSRFHCLQRIYSLTGKCKRTLLTACQYSHGMANFCTPNFCAQPVAGGEQGAVTSQTLTSVCSVSVSSSWSSATVLEFSHRLGGGDESELAAREIVTYFPKSDSHKS